MEQERYKGRKEGRRKRMEKGRKRYIKQKKGRKHELVRQGGKERK